MFRNTSFLIDPISKLKVSRRTLLRCAVIALVVIVPVARVFWVARAAASRTWTGASIINPNPGLRNNFWTTAENWSGNVAPVAGDDLTFPSSSQQNSLNTFANGTIFNSISVSGGHVMSGNSVSLNAGITATTGVVSLSSVKLNNNQTFSATAAGVQTIITSAIDNNSKNLTLDGPGIFTISGIISGAGGLTKSGSGTNQLVGSNSYTGLTQVIQGALLVFGDQHNSDALVFTGASLGGAGTVKDVTLRAGGIISPGGANNGTGILNVNGNITFSSFNSFDLDLNSTTVGSGYDQLKVNGGIFIGSDNNLLHVNLGFTPLPGATFIIIDNQGSGAVSGEFSGHPEGSALTVNGTTFVITYRGGDSNDVALHVPQTKTWDGGGADINWTTRANWDNDIAPLAGDNLVFPDNAPRNGNFNDFPANTTFGNISIAGNNYTLLGNAVSLSGNLDNNNPANGGSNFIGFAINGAGTLSMSGGLNSRLIINGNHGYTGTTTVNAGTLFANGVQQSSPFLVNGGVLTGIGTIGPLTANTGTVEPEISGGSINALDVSGDATFSTSAFFKATLKQFGSTVVPGQLEVAGHVTLNGCGLLSQANFSAPPPGPDLIILKNDGVNAVVGTFQNLPEGSIYSDLGFPLGISYRGGDGNDIVLHVATTRTWDGGGATANWTEAANWVGDVAPGPGDDLIFPAGAARLSNINDFPSGTTFTSISISGVPYTLGGNAIALISGINDSSGSSSFSNRTEFASIKLIANQTFTKAASSLLEINSAIDTNGKTLTLDGAGSKLLDQEITGTGGLTGNGPGDVFTRGGSFSGPTVINSGRLILNSSQPNSQLQLNGGEFFGRAEVNSIVATGGTIHSQTGTSTTSSNNVTLNSAVTFDVGVRRTSTAATNGTFLVRGAIDLGNSTLTVNPSFNVTPTVGDTFTIITKTSAGAVQGTFNNLPEGARLMIGGQPFRISYVGGNGNDVALIAENLTVQFNNSLFVVGEGDQRVNLTLTRSGDASGPASLSIATSDAAGSQPCNAFNGNASARCDYTITFGTVDFAAGETSKSISIPIVDDSYAEGNENFTVTLNNPSGAFLGTQSTTTVTIVDNETTTGPNPVDNTDFFVRQHYLDFFSREPDPSGFNFWTGGITSCGNDQQCVDVKRTNTSAAFYLSIEFQGTGYLVERIYKAAYGDRTASSTFPSAHQLPVPIVRLNEFLPDAQEIGRGVVVGQGNWEQTLENNKQAFTSGFVQRSRFQIAFPTSMTPAQFVDTLNANADNPLSQTERDQLVNDLTSGVKTRAQVLRAVAEDPDLNNAEFNRAFVLMQFFGYLRRNPDDPQDTDYTGYDFWLTKLNQFNGNFNDAEMVKAFIFSTEYRQRFGP